MAIGNNLLISLHKWAQDENFVTESFANLLERLLDDDHAVAVDILTRLTNGQFPPKATDSKLIRIRTQVTGQFGRPDIEFSCGASKVVVEVKLDAGLGDNQLNRYRKELSLTVADGNHALVLLSRHAVAIDPMLEDYVIAKRWYDVVDCLIQHQHNLQHPISRYLTQQFTEFAEYRGMTIEKVGDELIAGVPAIRNLCKMIQLWIEGQKRTLASSFGRDWSGFYTNSGSKDYFVGIQHDEPHKLVFENEGAKFDAAAVTTNTNFQQVRRPYGRRWCMEMILNDPNDNFFELSREMQIGRIEKFLSAALAEAESVRV